MNFDDCPCSGKHLLKMVKPMLMALLARGAAHGYALKRELETCGLLLGSTPDLSGIYRTLKEMEEKGFVASNLDASESGPAKRCYRLTDSGRECLARWRDTLQAYQRQLAGVVALMEEKSAVHAPRLILVGGFLGSGKTTLLAASMHALRNKGLKVGLITNDQAPGLVDTAWLAGDAGGKAEVREVSGSCFCCNFNGFAEALKILAERGVDVILAEPVGSCTDLSATILQPLKALHGKEYALAPYTVLLDPDRAREALGRTETALHRDAFYIVNLQLAEADRILLNKADTLDAATVDSLVTALRKEFPRAGVGSVSGQTGSGLDAWLDAVRTAAAGESGRTIVPVDYDRYATGEAALGWLNLSAEPVWTTDASPGIYLAELLFRIRRDVNARGFEVGHIKALLPAPGGTYIGNWVDSRREAEIRKANWAGARAEPLLLLNARVECEPEVLEQLVRKALAEVGEGKVKMTVRDCYCLKPGRPAPTHRYSAVV